MVKIPFSNSIVGYSPVNDAISSFNPSTSTTKSSTVFFRSLILDCPGLIVPDEDPAPPGSATPPRYLPIDKRGAAAVRVDDTFDGAVDLAAVVRNDPARTDPTVPVDGFAPAVAALEALE